MTKKSKNFLFFIVLIINSFDFLFFGDVHVVEKMIHHYASAD